MMGLDAMIFIFEMLSLKPAFSLSSFTFKKLFSSSSLSAIRVVSSAFLRLLIFLSAIMIPACASFSPAFCMMYSAYKLNNVNYKLALTKSIANEWRAKAFATCLYGVWTQCCYSCWPSITPEGLQGGVRPSVLQGIWWDRSLDSWMFLGTYFMISIAASPHI